MPFHYGFPPFFLYQKNCLTNLTWYNDNEIMKTLQSAKAKTHFSSVLKDVEAGNEVAIVYGKRKLQPFHLYITEH